MKLIKLIDTEKKIKVTDSHGKVTEKPTQTFMLVMDLGVKRVFIPIKPAFDDASAKARIYHDLETFAIKQFKKQKETQK